MDDLTTKLREIAGSPCSVLDLERIAERADRRRRRRWTGEASALVLAIAVALAGYTIAFEAPTVSPEIVGEIDREPAPSSEPQVVPSVEDREAAETGTSAPAPDIDRRTDPGPVRNDGTATPMPTEAVTRAVEPTEDSSVPPAPRPEPSETLTTGSGCEVQTGSCSFVASGPGGFRADDSDWSVTVERDGQRTVYTAATHGYCADDVIQASDHVVVDAGIGEDPGPVEGGVIYGYRYVGAGEGYGC